MNKVFYKRSHRTDYKLNNLYFTEHLYYWIYLQIYSKHNSIYNLPLSQSITTRQFNSMYKNYNKYFTQRDKLLEQKYTNYHIRYYILHYKELDLDDKEERIDGFFINEVLDVVYILRKFIKRVYFKVFIKPQLEFNRAINMILMSKTYNYGLGLKLSMRDCGLELSNS